MLTVMRFPVRNEDVATLQGWLRSSSIRAGLAQRARIVLLSGEGMGTTAVAERLGVSRPTVILWRDRYQQGGVDALVDLPRPGRRSDTDEAGIIARTLEAPPDSLGVTHWSSRLLAREMRVSNVTVAKVWRKYGLQPWRTETFKFSTDPDLDAKIRDVVGLYLNPPDNAVVVCVDEKSQVQALDRTAPILPLRPGLPERHTHDYVRHDTTTLFAALNVATGQVVDACHERHRHQEFLAFLKQVARAYPKVPLHVVCDNYATHKHPAVREWLAKHPRIQLHFTPTSGSWLNMAEIFFGIITRQAIRRGTFTSVKDLVAAIGTFIDGWNERCQPFVWTKTADDILTHARPRKGTSLTRH